MNWILVKWALWDGKSFSKRHPPRHPPPYSLSIILANCSTVCTLEVHLGNLPLLLRIVVVAKKFDSRAACSIFSISYMNCKFAWKWKWKMEFQWKEDLFKILWHSFLSLRSGWFSPFFFAFSDSKQMLGIICPALPTLVHSSLFCSVKWKFQ